MDYPDQDGKMEQEEESKTIMLRGLSLHVTEEDVCLHDIFTYCKIKAQQAQYVRCSVWLYFKVQQNNFLNRVNFDPRSSSHISDTHSA